MRAILAASVIAALAGCVLQIDLGGRECPCGAGWACCEAAERCVPEGTTCPDAGPADECAPCGCPGDAGTPDAGGADAGPDPCEEAQSGECCGDPIQLRNAGVQAGCFNEASFNHPTQTTFLRVTRLTPPGYPFRLTGVRGGLKQTDYLPTHDVQCEAGLPFEFVVFTGADSVPPENPEILRTISVPRTTQTTDYIVDAALEEPLVVTSGEIFVGFRSPPATYPQTLCWGICITSKELTRSYAAQSAQPPFAWIDAIVAGRKGNYALTAEGCRIKP